MKENRFSCQHCLLFRINVFLQYLPEYQFKPEELRMFPKAIIDEAVQAFNRSELPPGYGE